MIYLIQRVWGLNPECIASEAEGLCDVWKVTLSESRHDWGYVSRTPPFSYTLLVKLQEGKPCLLKFIFLGFKSSRGKRTGSIEMIYRNSPQTDITPSSTSAVCASCPLWQFKQWKRCRWTRCMPFQLVRLAIVRVGTNFRSTC